MRIKFYDKNDIELLKRSILYVQPYRSKFFILLACILVGMAFGLVQPLVWGKTTVNFLDKNCQALLGNILLLCVLRISEIIIGFARSIYFSKINSSIVFDINRDVYKKVIDLQLTAFDEMRVGDFISRLNGDTGVISSIITNQLLNTIVDILKIVLIGIIIFKINIILALVTIFAFPISYVVFLLFGRVLRKKNKELREIYDNYFSTIQQSLVAIRDVKGLGIKDQVIKRFLFVSNSLKKNSIEMNKISAFSNAAGQSINFLTSIVVISIGAYFVFKGSLSIGVFVAFTTYSSQFSTSLQNITELSSTIQKLLSSLERVFDLIDNKTYKNEKFGNKHIEHLKGDIRFQGVHFEYVKGKPIFNELTFHIKHNTKIAIVGRSGAGKSTIFNLLLNFYSPNSGSIEIDGTDINELDEETIRSNISFIRQDPFLFNMSIKDNLLIANNKAGDEDIINACKAAFIHDYIMSLPNKYDSVIGENGVNFSGGQKQRIAIARGLLKNSKIILFDEATSSLDNESQYFIKEAINFLSNNRTIIIIAHRLSTIIDADEILIVGEGELIGRGSHKNLIKRNSLYQKLYETELKMFSDIDSGVG